MKNKKTSSTKSQSGNNKLPTFKKASGTTTKLPSFKKASNAELPILKKTEDFQSPSFKMAAEPKVYKVVDDLIEDSDDDFSSDSSKAQYFDQVDVEDDSIEEEDLIDENDSGKPMITMITCGKSKTKKKKASL